MNWDAADFIIFFGMLAVVIGGYWMASRRSRSAAYRAAAGLALIAAFLLLWINGAVGIIGDANNDANLMYFGVLAVAVAGGLAARFEPGGMSRAMYATAFAQVFVAGVALLGVSEPPGPAWPLDVLVLTVIFVAAWLLSARLFRAAARP